MNKHALVICGCIVLVLAGVAEAQPHSDIGDLYLEFGMNKFDIDGEFDDSLVLTTSSQLVNVPEVLETSGYSIAVGRAWNQGGLSFFYLFGNPETRSVLGDSDGRYHLYGMDVYGLPFTKKNNNNKISPLVRGSISLVSLGIDDSATDGMSVVPATFRGFAAAIGIGALVQLGSNFHFTAEVDRRWMSFNTVEGVGDPLDMEESMTLTTDFLRVGLSIYQ